MHRRYALLDVFTDQPLSGNPLAVVLDGDGLACSLMQRIAGEFDLSETVFVTSVDDDGARAKIRIFTPMQELPFAGHPTVGTAILLAGEQPNDDGARREIVLEEGIGAVRCVVSSGPMGARASFELPRLPEPCGDTGSSSVIATALGLDESDIGFDNHYAEQWSAGLPFSLVPVQGLKAIEEINHDPGFWSAAFGEGHHNNAFVYTRECVEEGSDFHARMFWPGAGVREDPATGSAVAAFAGLIVAREKPGDGKHSYRIEQGYEMGRPSQIKLELSVVGGVLDSARIGGGAVVLARGSLLI
jgi:trans-2,3-dihydro-3-hydroxyanthranilate isomerase